MKPEKVLLIDMPFSPLDRPDHRLSLLKAKLMAEDIECDVRYFKFAFADILGAEMYNWIAGKYPNAGFDENRLINAKSSAYETGQPNRTDEGMISSSDIAQADRSKLEYVRSRTSQFLDCCMESIRWRSYSLICLSRAHPQSTACEALTRCIHDRYPMLSVKFLGSEEQSYLKFAGSTSNMRKSDRLWRDMSLETFADRIVLKIGREQITGEIDTMTNQVQADYTDFMDALEESLVGEEIIPLISKSGSYEKIMKSCSY